MAELSSGIVEAGREAGPVGGSLYVVATPIGHLSDLGARAAQVLRDVDVVAAEDTRISRVLLERVGSRATPIAAHQHNEPEAGRRIIALLEQGRSVALVTDAGTPGISDPGALLVAAAHRAGVRVVPVPGPNAAVAAYSAAGFAADRFLFAGFLPAKAAARRKALEALELPWPVVLYEAPHRVAETLADLHARFGGEREIVIARELTKKFEEVARMPLAQALDWLRAHAQRAQGEFVLVLAPGAPSAPDALQAERVLDILLEALPASEAARLAARISGAPRNALYRKALERGK